MPAKHPRLTLKPAVLAVLLAFPAQQALAVTCGWNTTNGNWNETTKWGSCVTGNGNPVGSPGSVDTANIGATGVVTINTGQSINTLNNAGQINIDAFGLNLVGGGSTTNSGVINVGGASTANIGVSAGHNINNTGGTINIDDGSVVNQFGSTITGGTVSTSGTGRMVATASGSNFLSGVTLNGLLDMSTATGFQRITDGLALGGTISVNLNSVLAFQDTNTVSGGGTIVLGSTGASNRIALDGTGTTTFAAGTTVRGQNGTIGNAVFLGGTQALVNNGTISADVAGGTITISSAPVTNGGTMSALNGGTLVLSSNVTGNPGGQIVAAAGSTVLQNGVTLSGTINTSGSGRFAASGSSNNFLDGVTLNGNLDLATATGLERVTAGGLVLNGTIDLNNNSVLAFTGDGGLSGNGTVVLGSTGASNRIGLDGNGTTTFAAGTTVRGQNGTIGNNVFVGGAQTLVNNGTISADVAGGTITIAGSPVTNGGTMSALNGGTLVLSSNVTGNPGGQIVAGAGSTVLQNGVTLSGTINTSGSGRFAASGSSNNFLDGVTLNGNLDLATATGLERVTAGGLVLNGTIDLNNNSVLAFTGDGGLSGNGTVVLGSTGASNRIALDGNGTTTFAAGTTVRGQNGTIGNNVFVGGAQTLVNNGTISADVAGGTITIAGSPVTNSGTMSALNGGTLVLSSNVTGNPGGQIVAGAGSTVLQNGVTLSGTINTSGSGRFAASGSSNNFLDGVTLNGNLDLATATGLERVTAGGLVLNGTIDLNNNSVLAFTGDGGLSGNGTVVLGSTGASNRIALDGNGTTTFAAGTTVRGQNGTIGNNVFVGGAQTLVNNGTINSDSGGTITFGSSALVNNGLVRAQAGTMNVGVALSGSGTLQVDGAGTMSLANGAKTQGQLQMGATGAALNLGTGNLTITGDYTNVGAGTGNAFNRRAGVSGTGQILAGGNAAQAITGTGVTNGNTANATLTIGNVRVGATTFDYQIANTGTTGPALRGAIQTTAGGANLTDARLSGAGVTAGNYDTGAPGSNTGNLGVTFTAASAGALAAMTGQVLNLSSNFENIPDQKLNIVLGTSAAAYNAAIGNTTSPIQVANQRIGGSNSAAVIVANHAAASAFSEDLNASVGGSTGAASGSGSITGRLAATNNTGTGAINVGVNTASAGAKTGTVTLDYETAGTVAGVSNGLGSASVGSQGVTVNGNVYQIAQASPASLPATVNLGNFRAGAGAQAQTINITNTDAGAPVGFQEGLAANIGTVTGTATGTGFGNAAVGTSGALQVGLSGIAAGNNTGTVQVQLQSNGVTTTGTNNLAALNLGSAQTITVNGAGYRLASANTLGAISFGNVHVGDTVQQALNITNTAINDLFSEKLNASFGASSDSRITTSGSISQLAAGSSNNSSMIVGLNTTAAGSVNGTQVVNFASDGSGTSGLGITALPSQTIGVSGDIATSGSVFRLASASPATPNPVNFGAVRINSTTDQALSIMNTAANDGFSEKLNASISTNGAPVTASGSFNLLAAQGTDSSSLHVGIDTNSAGAKSGSATIALVSDGTGTSNLGTTNLAPQTVNVSGDVYRLADPTLNTTSVNLVARRGDAAPTAAISVTNSSPDSFTEGLNGGFASATPATGFAASGNIANLAAQGTNASSLQVGLDTSTAGNFTGNAQVDFESTGAGTTGAADISVGNQLVSLAGKVYEKAIAQVNTALVDFGIVHKGDVVTAKNVSVSNTAAAAGLNDTLQGSFITMPSGPFGGSGSVDVAAGQTDAGSLLVSLDTSNAGVFSSNGDKLQFASHNADMADMALGNASLALQAQVNNYVDPKFLKTSGAGVLSGAGLNFTLDFGTLTQGSGMVSALLALANDASGPADLLDGAYTLAINEFLKSGFVDFTDLAAGQSQGGLQISLDTLNVGSFSDSIVLSALGHNASGFSATFGDVTLTVQARVQAGGGGQVPEPGSLLLLTIALAIIVLQRRREMLD